MMQRRIPVAREGWPFIALPGALALGLALAGRHGLALPFGAAALASLGFFRDPERVIPTVPNAVLAPADGRVMAVEEVDDPFVGRAVRVVIFLSPLDVHVNRAPVAGLVVETVRTKGRYVAAYEPEAGEVNERCAIHLQGESARVKVVQIVGVVARRIVCRVAAGDKVAAGDRIGMIRFGSRTDCYMPWTTSLRVRAGDTVRGASSILGVLA